ncbi:hypothetical protein EC2735000_4942 [Escherichia coli 2735000]|nr:hypothetical protein EC2735000_4942 [Escherichia coli 2735000]
MPENFIIESTLKAQEKKGNNKKEYSIFIRTIPAKEVFHLLWYKNNAD